MINAIFMILKKATKKDDTFYRSLYGEQSSFHALYLPGTRLFNW